MSLHRQQILARYYDPIAAASLREHVVLRHMLASIGTAPERILHLGCGRGWLTQALARHYPACEVVGLDADADVLAGASELARTSATPLTFVLGTAEVAPVRGRFDAIVSSLLFHHLTRDAKRAAFTRAAELLVPTGRMLVGDFGRPQDAVMRAAFIGVQLAHGFDDTADNLDGRYLELMSEANLVAPREVGRWRSWLGSVALYQAQAPL
ncbi:MAG: class I SAM-dependent methyltransferase [Kofleriaceae bacterium]|nr:class I SAM-dependent methyltransferase [Kofleriaceae bacterium]